MTAPLYQVWNEQFESFKAFESTNLSEAEEYFLNEQKSLMKEEKVFLVKVLQSFNYKPTLTTFEE